MEDQAIDSPKPEQDPVLEEVQPLSEEDKQGNGPNGAEIMAVETHDVASKKTKQSLKTKQVTVPQPFSLATEKRMGRERKGSVELPSPAAKPKLSKSASLSHRTRSSSEKAGEISTSSKLKAPTAPAKTEINPAIKERKEIESKKSQVTPNPKKQIEAEKESKKMGKSSTFKASPLPSFYSRKVPVTKPELKKTSVSVTQPKAHSVAQRSKVVKNKVEDKEKVSSKPIIKEKMNTLIASAPKSFDVSKLTVETIVSSA